MSRSTVRHSGARQLAAVLFTDIVDSTAIASRVGDARWATLIARHHAVVRRALRRHRGTEHDTAGDGFFASFREPAEAIRCACEISDEVRELGIEIRAAVHFGEAEWAAGKLSGLAVVVCARVMSQGTAGEVLVTASTADLVAGAGLSFGEPSELELKGVDGTWRVVRVTRIDGQDRPGPSTAAEAQERLAGLMPDARTRRWTWVAGVAALSIVAATLIFLAQRSSPAAAINLAANTVARLDASRESVTNTVPLGARPGAGAVGFDSVWVTWPDRGRVARLDARTGRIVDTVAVGASPAGLVVTDDAVWVANAANRTISRIDPGTNEVTRTVTAGTFPTAVTYADGALWVADSIGSKLLRIDPASGHVTAIGLAGQPVAVTSTSSGVWVAVAPSSVVRVDPETSEVTLSQAVGDGPSSVLEAAGSIWVANQLDGTVSRLDPSTGNLRATIPVGGGPGSLVQSQGRIWVANEYGTTITAIDPDANEVDRRIAVGASIAGLAPDGTGRLWLLATASADEHRGGELRVGSEQSVRGLDPAASYDLLSWQILSVTTDGLVALRKTGGANGANLVPDLAAALPQVSPDGLTYRFTLRPGVRYSTGELVDAADIRHGLERAVSLSGDAAFAFEALPGADACHRRPDSCDLSASIAVDGPEITMTLSRPDPDLLYKLSLPWGAATSPEVPNTAQKGPAIPATGPYRVSRVGARGLELVRNPSFATWSAAAQPDGYVDSISWEFKLDAHEMYQRILSGDLDLMAEDVTPTDFKDLRAEHPEQMALNARPATFQLEFDSARPPFDDPRVRRAVAYSIDRDEAATLLGESSFAQVTCQILPPSIPGYESRCSRTRHPASGLWSATDLRRAKALIKAAHARGNAVNVLIPGVDLPPGWATLMRRAARTLSDELGLNVTTRQVSGNYFDQLAATPPGDARHPQFFVSGWIADYPSAGNFLEPQFRCGAAGNITGFCDPAIDRLMDRAKALAAVKPDAATRTWTRAERALLRQDAVVPLTNDVSVSAVSKRLGDVQTHLQWSVLLSRVWVR